VVDADGSVIGSLDRRAVIDTLIGREKRAGEGPR
jgi:hypothetical protein